MSIIPRPPANPPPQPNEQGKSLMSEYMEAPPPPSKQGGTNLEALFERKPPFLAQDSNALEQLFRKEKDMVGGRQTALPSLVSQRRSSSPGPEVQRRRGEQQANGFWGLVQVCYLPQMLLAYQYFPGTRQAVSRARRVSGESTGGAGCPVEAGEAAAAVAQQAERDLWNAREETAKSELGRDWARSASVPPGHQPRLKWYEKGAGERGRRSNSNTRKSLEPSHSYAWVLHWSGGYPCP